MGIVPTLCTAVLFVGYQSASAPLDKQVRDVHGTHVKLSIEVSGSEVLTVSSDIQCLADGKSRSAGKVISQDNSWSVEWNFVLDLDARDEGRMCGKTIWVNSGDRTRSCILSVFFPLDPLIESAAEVRSDVRVEVASSTQSSRAEVLDSGSGWSMLVDGVKTHAVMDFPFFLSSAHSQNISAQARVGHDDHWSSVGGIRDTLGIQSHWQLHPGDSIAVHTDMYVRGEPGRFLKRRDTTSAVVIGSTEERLRIRTKSSGNAQSRGAKTFITVRPRKPRDGNRIQRNN